ncbi:aspartate--tRNA ligase [Candidatus Woesearchaeota archaeon]|nr:aspartate--tRNA ligase [Candidatus Woesearchaeota archaeon]
MLRTHTCGELNEKLTGKKVELCGWIAKIRGHGDLVFLDLRDRYGITQVVFNSKDKKLFEEAQRLGREYVVKIKGEVKQRPKGMENPKLSTGKIELVGEGLEVLNASEVPPIDMIDDTKTDEEIRMKYRFLDLRRPVMQKRLRLRHDLIKSMRDYLDKEDFIEIETPILSKSTPEGARDYLVPSRVHSGKFYALPQSPQTLKQICMVAGLDKYYQIARCFRDEDLRADRQPEFTQLDLEMSFVDEEDVFKVIEGVVKNMWKSVLNVDLKTPFPRMSYEDAMKKYKTDKPDLRKKKDEWCFLWVTDFPLFEYDEAEKKWNSAHHPFTSPKDDKFDKYPKKALSRAYDLVLNGTELGSGSIRINRQDIQKKLFNVIGLSEKEIETKFGFLINAFKFGAPPHGGIALGIDRIAALAAGLDNIREITAFPKNKEAKDLMLDSPSEASEKQLKEAHVKLEVVRKKDKSF